MTATKKVITILGTRPEIIKLSPVIPLLKEEFEHLIVHTGQHYSANLDHVFFEELQLPKPDYNLHIGSGAQGYQTGKMMIELEKIFAKEKPDAVVVQGDTNTAPAVALTAVKMHIPIMHIESGSRSFKREMPEEINRVIADQLADVLFANDEICKKNLRQEGIDEEKIKIVGNTAVDALERNKKLADDGILQRLAVSKKEYILTTVHRAENTQEKNLREIIEALNEIAEKKKIIFPMHPRTKNAVEKYGIEVSKRIVVLEPVGFLEFIALMDNALFVVTDSGGIQRECAGLNVPCLVVRNETEAKDVFEAGKTILIGNKKEGIVSKVAELIESPEKIIEIENKPYVTKENISENIVKEIARFLELR